MQNSEGESPPLPPTLQFPLPAHLCVELWPLVEEVGDLGALRVTVGVYEDGVLRLRRQVRADVMNRKHDPLHFPVVAHNLNSGTQIQEREELMNLKKFRKAKHGTFKRS